ncbi:hypothetical protein NDN08_000322 [Rhodosorus marinus]|uniref:Uncharacterized protein n=1 Tax=Rhodosorus marinus TaxID=101924 RepID=A0AAV8URT3_9RHOD|nr:hypothetical protein NDN08_000322 [Rhodosorus marinus]
MDGMTCFVSGIGSLRLGGARSTKTYRCERPVMTMSEFDAESESDCFDLSILKKRINTLKEENKVHLPQSDFSAAPLREAVDKRQKYYWVMIDPKRRDPRVEDYMSTKVCVRVNDGETMLGFEARDDAIYCSGLFGDVARHAGANDPSPNVVRRPLEKLEDYCVDKGWNLGIVLEGAVDLDERFDPRKHELVAEVDNIYPSDLPEARKNFENLFRKF